MPFGDFPICGIGGILRITPPGETHEPIPEAWLDAIDDAIAWRGPDGAGRFRDTVVKDDGTTVEVALVHRRLSIIDHAGGAQPMVSEHGRTRDDGTREGLVAVVFNGCIYNHRELREELEKRGHVFETDHSDTEVLVHLHREIEQLRATTSVDYESDEYYLGEELLPDGMYAFTIWDQNSLRLYNGIDLYKEKPYFCTNQSDGETVFASTPGAIWNDVIRPRKSLWQRHTQLVEIISRGFPKPEWGYHAKGYGPDFAGVESDPPAMGCRDFFQLGLIIVAIPILIIGWVFSLAQLFWLLAPALLAAIVFYAKLPIPHSVLTSPVRQLRGHGIRASSQRIDGMLARAIASRLEADVPLGCLLSGGIDSSLVAHYAMREIGSLTTVSIRMDDDRYDESRYAEMVAEHLGTDHHTIDVHPEPAQDLIHLISLIGLPFGDSSLLPIYWACKAAREHVKVVLTGDGADELFYGYERYKAMRYLRWARFAAPFVNTNKYDRSDPKSRSDKLARFFEAAKGDGYLDLVSIFPRADREKLFGKGTSYKADRVWSVRGARKWDLRNYLPGDLLRKTDTASMATGVELRAPFLARELSEHVRRLPLATLMPVGKRKALLKSIARKHLPHEIIDRPKMGFAIPVGEWFRTDYGGMRTLMMDTLTRPDPFGPCHDVIDFNMDYVRTMIREHDDRTRDHSQRLYMLTVLGVWADTLQQ